MKRSNSRRRVKQFCIALAGAAVLSVVTDAVARASAIEDAVRIYKRGVYSEAEVALQRLADAGNTDATFWLAMMWHQGRGKPVNHRTAAGLYRIAAYHGNADAQNNLGLLYRDGLGVERSRAVSYAWFSLAAAQRNDIAKRNLERLTEDLSDTEIRDGQKLAAEYLEWIAQTQARAAGLDRVEKAEDKDLNAREERAEATGSNASQATGNSVAGAAGSKAAKVIPITVAASTKPSTSIGRVKAAPVQSAVLKPAVVEPSTSESAEPRGRDGYVVQLGLFRNNAGIQRLEASLGRTGIDFERRAVTIGQTEYQRFRVGPFENLQEARRAAKKLDRLFHTRSAVIHTSG